MQEKEKEIKITISVQEVKKNKRENN